MKLAKAAILTAATAALALGSLQAPAQAEPVAVAPEESDVAKLEAPRNSWFFIQRGFVLSGTSIYDSVTGKLLGQVETPTLGDMALDPKGKAYYVSQTIWTKGWRGTRQDLFTVYDSTDLKVQADIAMPGRLLVGGRKNNVIVIDEGKTALVYNYSPASSVNVIDLEKRKFVKAVELPGCADLIPNPGVGFSALCNDGSMATVTLAGAKSSIAHTAPFFKATDDPVFDNFAYDKAKKQVVMLTYTGQVFTAAMSATPTISEPFSIQQAAGMKPAGTAPLELAWYPGGGQPMALHRASGHLYVLMHKGEYWTHKDGGEEVWDVDLAARKVVKRVAIKGEPRSIEVTQGDSPQLIMAGEDETVRTIDVATWTPKHAIEHAGGGVITVIEP